MKRIKKEIRLKCIRKFFFEKYKDIANANKKLRKLGLEASLEACIGLFDDGSLRLVADDEKNFLVFLIHPTTERDLQIKKGDEELIYDSTGELV